MRTQRLNSLFAASLVALAVTLPAASSAADASVRVRGTVVSRTADELDVKSREGDLVKIKLKQGWMPSAVVKAAMSDIKPGDYVGIASLPKAEGGDGALEVLIFPPAMKGVGEGSFGYDLKPESSMTNATVSNAVKSVDGGTVTVTYHGQEKKIAIPAGTPVVTLGKATIDDVKAGAAIFVVADKAADGNLTAGYVVVGKNGVVPPM
jgi:Cu/Ag efflux protein CusF